MRPQAITELEALTMMHGPLQWGDMGQCWQKLFSEDLLLEAPCSNQFMSLHSNCTAIADLCNSYFKNYFLKKKL